MCFFGFTFGFLGRDFRAWFVEKKFTNDIHKNPTTKSIKQNTYRIMCRKVLHPEEIFVCVCPNRISSQKSKKKKSTIGPIKIKRYFLNYWDFV